MIRGDDLACGRISESCGLAQQVGHEAELEHPEAEARAGLAGEQADDLLEAALEHIGRLQEDPLPLRGDRLRPGGERVARSVDRACSLRARAGRDERNDVAGERITILERAAFAGDPFTADEVLVLAYAGLDARHGALLSPRHRWRLSMCQDTVPYIRTKRSAPRTA